MRGFVREANKKRATKRKGAVARPSPSVTKGNSRRALSRDQRNKPATTSLGGPILQLASCCLAQLSLDGAPLASHESAP